MKFAIAVHNPYSETDGGLNCIINLGKMMNDMGHDARLFVAPHYNTNYENNTVCPYYIQPDEMEEDRIAVYIDCTLGNPLGAKKVVRYISYGSHWYPDYDANEIVYYHAPFCKNNPAPKILTPLSWPSGLENKGFHRINEQCHILKKGIRDPAIRAALSNPTGPPDPRSAGSIDLSGMNHSQLIEMFNTTKYFYCFDPCCFLIIMSLMCGCIVIQFPIPGCNAEEWKYTIGLQGLNGIAYGAENLPHAEATIGLARDDCMKLKEQNQQSVINFCRDMETGNYTTEPCYKFNDSPYSLQHIWKD
jgi:hypothetical protein